MPLPLSRKQMDVLKELETFSRRRGYIPSVRELAARLKRSPTTIFQHLKALEKKGYVSSDGSAHGWKIVNRPRKDGGETRIDLVAVPVSGTIVAGAPLEAVEDRSETLHLPRGMVPAGAFALRVQGDSMIEDHILDGDLVIVRPQSTVADGDVAVALLPDGSATLKRVYRERDRVRLQPANASMKPFYAAEVAIQGRVVAVWRCRV